jgi:AraC family transcriptional regulator
MTRWNSETYFAPATRIRLPDMTLDTGEFRSGGPFEQICDSRPDATACMVLSKHPLELSGYLIHDSVFGHCRAIGMFNFFPPGASMYVRSAGAPVSLVRCTIDAERFRTTTSIDDLDRRALTACLNVPAKCLGEPMSRLARELAEPGFASEIILESCALGIMGEIARYLRKSRDLKTNVTATLSAWQLRRIDEFLNEFEGCAPTVSGLAEKCGISRSHLSRLFKATTGVAVYDYIVDVRVKRAKAYLIDTDLPLKDISYRLGFSQAASFSQAFRRAVGETPRSYRQLFHRRSRGRRAAKPRSPVPHS